VQINSLICNILAGKVNCPGLKFSIHWNSVKAKKSISIYSFYLFCRMWYRRNFISNRSRTAEVEKSQCAPGQLCSCVVLEAVV
jgi:hypothetical protein